MPYTYRLDLSYSGAPFHGWQSQPDGMGVQDHLERALGIILKSPIKIMGASRTDSGVHAEHQVAMFTEPRNLEAEKLIAGINALTPREVSVWSLRAVKDGFHPILSAKAKCYRYRVWMSPVVSPFWAAFTWQVKGVLDTVAMDKASILLTGKHDFSSFCAADSGAKTRVRDIKEILIDVRGPLIDIWIMGGGFLKHMVRNIVGTLVEVGLARRPWDSMPLILEGCDRAMAGVTAPAHGLALVKIFYEEVHSCMDLVHKAQGGYSMAIPSEGSN